MLFFIDESVVEAAERGDSTVLNRLEDLYHCWLRGLCIIGSSRKNFNRIIGIEKLNCYRLVEKSVQGIQSLYDDLAFFIVLTYKHKKCQSLNQYSEKIREIDIESMNGIFDLSLNFLVCENVMDYDFYCWITEQRDVYPKNNLFHLNILPFNGGGATTVTSLKHVQKHFCLVICDSDVKYEGAQKGSTCKEVCSYVDYLYTIGVNSVWRYVLTVHEVENLIPLDILQRIAAKGTIKKLREIQSKIYGDTFLSYFDFKEGFKESTYRTLYAVGNNVFANHRNLFLSIGKNEGVMKKILKRRYKKGKDNCIVHGLGQTVLADTVNFLMNNNISARDYSLCRYQNNDWGQISKLIWSLGCAVTPKNV